MGKRNSKKTVKISLDLKPIWKISKGHANHLSGGGCHDHRPNRMRTRGDQRRRSIEDYS